MSSEMVLGSVYQAFWQQDDKSCHKLDGKSK